MKKLFFTACFLGFFIMTAQQKKTKANDKKTKKQIKPYEQVITKDAKTDDGLFKVHRTKEKGFFEIPEKLLGRELLIVTRFAKSPQNLSRAWKYGGSKLSTYILRFDRYRDQIVLKIISHNISASKEKPIYKAVENSNFAPILYTFPIQAIHKKTKNIVIQVDEFITSDIAEITLPKYFRKKYKIGDLDASRCYVHSVKSYTKNIEIRTVRTYHILEPNKYNGLSAISMELSNSIILLPEKPMKRRYFDERVGWFTTSQVDYGIEAQKTKEVTYIDRWSLEVKPEDIEKFKKGELVEPKKPIVYYIDPATPKKWRKYLKQGVEDWQKAFEVAGFKNAIIIKDPPSEKENPEWSPEDVRYSVIRYLASDIPNALGPHVSDPRSGEILEADIQWFHNVMSLLHNWYFIQTAAINPQARAPEFKEEVMGRLIRYVCAHEVGHTLGLPHNMASSSSYPVDSLRSATFTKKYGTAPSIMDYARYNYVAQPEDKDVTLVPDVGVYDKYAIAWGYRPILDKDAESEKEILDQWILEKANDPMYRFGEEYHNVVDPSSQIEDLGDDAVKASEYGIRNLKRIMPNLKKWTYQKGKNYENLKNMYKQLLKQYTNYMNHVAFNIGGVYEHYNTYDQDQKVYIPVAKSHQQRCVRFLNTVCFTTPKWLINKEIFSRTNYSGHTESIRDIQQRVLYSLLDLGRMFRLIEASSLTDDDTYTLLELLQTLRKSIFIEIDNDKPTDIYRRSLQRAFVEKLLSLLGKKQPYQKVHANAKYTNFDNNFSDIIAVVRGEVLELLEDLEDADGQNKVDTYHFEDLAYRIIKKLDLKK